jgi:hypothetical protein
MKFFTKINTEKMATAKEAAQAFQKCQETQLAIEVMTNGASPTFLIQPTDGGYKILSLDERFEAPSKKFTKVQDAIAKIIADNNTEVYYLDMAAVAGTRGVGQWLASIEPLSSTLENCFTIHKSDAVAMIAIAQKVLNLPVTVNGHDIKPDGMGSEFHKILVNNNRTYTCDSTKIVKR